MISISQEDRKESQSKFYLYEPRCNECDQQQLSRRLFRVSSHMVLVRSQVYLEGITESQEFVLGGRLRKLLDQRRYSLMEQQLWGRDTGEASSCPDKILDLSSSYCWHIPTLWKLS